MIAADGTVHNVSTYNNHGCRCDVCRAAKAADKAARRARVAANGLPSYAEHGASAYANWGCRCDDCRNDWARYYRARCLKRAAA